MLKERDRKIYDQGKKIALLEQDYFLNISKLKNGNADKEDTIATLANNIKELTT